MRRVSLKAAARKAATDEYRKTLKQQVGVCEWCSDANGGLSGHEIARGNGLRQKALDQPFAVLVLCDDCHRVIHDFKGVHAVAIGLALIKYRRPEDFSIEAFYKLTGRRWPDADLVERWYVRILAERARR